MEEMNGHKIVNQGRSETCGEVVDRPETEGRDCIMLKEVGGRGILMWNVHLLWIHN